MAKMAALFDIKLVFIAPEEVQAESDIQQYLLERKREFKLTNALPKVIKDLDVLEINRIRHEYFSDKERALKIGKQFVLNRIMVMKGKKNLIVLDPLPRINTVQEDVDTLPQAKYFEAVENGVYMRMALLQQVLK